jgi:hypothetical protein
MDRNCSIKVTDKALAEEYEQSAECIELDDYGKKVYGSLDIEKAFLVGLKAGRDSAETDLATVAYMQGADNQKKKADKQLSRAKEIIKDQKEDVGMTVYKGDKILMTFERSN